MNAGHGDFISSFVVAYGRLEASPRGQDDLHILLADRLGGRLSQQVAVGDYASGSILVHADGCTARINRLPRGVAREEVLRLVRKQFGDLGEVDLVVQEARMTGEIDQTWPWQWRPGVHGRAVLIEPDGDSPRLFSWSHDDDGAPQCHADARDLLSVDRAADLLIDREGGCSVYPDVPGLAELLPKLDPRLALRVSAEPENPPSVELRPWEPGDCGKGFLLPPTEAGGPPRVALWVNPGCETYFHAQLLDAMKLSSEDTLAHLAVDPCGKLTVYSSGELDGRSYVEWLLELDPRLSEPDDDWDFSAGEFAEPTSGPDAPAVELSPPASDASVRRALDDYLADALGAALTLADRAPIPAQLAERLSAAAGYVLQRDPHLRRLGRTASLNALAQFGTTPSALQAGWAAIVDAHLRPAGTQLLAEIRAHADLDAATLAQLDERLVEAGYLGRPEAGLWEHCEALARLLSVRRDLRAAPLDHEPLKEVGERALAALERLIGRFDRAITAACADGEVEQPRSPAGWARSRATGQEALADALLNPASRALTAELYASGSLDDHLEAVRRHVGEPVAVPVIVLANDRWFREMHPERKDPAGVHMRRQAILLSRSVGEQAAVERGRGRLSHTLVHELVHATQRDRRARRRPPYDARSFEVERKILEGLTEHFTQRVMRDARAKWQGTGENPYTQLEFRRNRRYHSWSIVCLAAIRAAGGLPDTFLRELSHNPHKLTMYVELLTGRYTAERKAAIVPVFEQLFALAEAWLAEPRRLESELPAVAERAFREYAANPC